MTHNKNSKQVEQLVQEHLEAVALIARAVIYQCPPVVNRDDLFQSGCLGLVQAARRYKADSNVPFLAYARKRIRGAMYDEIRLATPLSRRDWQRVQDTARVQEYLQGKSEHQVRAAMVAEFMGSGLDQYLSFEAMAQRARQPEPFEETNAPPALTPTPDSAYDKEETLKRLRLAVRGLTTLEHDVLILHDYRELPLKKIGLMKGLSESRISQIRSRAIARLKEGFLEN